MRREGLRLTGGDTMARSRARVFALGGLAFGLIGFTALADPTPRLVWNASASAPIGLYLLVPSGTVKYGDLVLAWLPDEVRVLASERGYLRFEVPLIKRVAALANDTICCEGRSVFVDQRPLAHRLDLDRMGRALPSWSGCNTLNSDQVLLLMEGVPDSFDGRYFGPSRTKHLLGRLVPLVTFDP